MNNVSHTVVKKYLPLILTAFLFVTSLAQAGSKPVPIEGAKFVTGWTMQQNINHFKNKEVTVHLKSGASFSGWVKEIGKDYLHIDNLKGQDFSDVLILTSEIVAFSAQFREYKD